MISREECELGAPILFFDDLFNVSYLLLHLASDLFARSTVYDGRYLPGASVDETYSRRACPSWMIVDPAPDLLPLRSSSRLRFSDASSRHN
jgi:hypothetical protein